MKIKLLAFASVFLIILKSNAQTDNFEDIKKSTIYIRTHYSSGSSECSHGIVVGENKDFIYAITTRHSVFDEHRKRTKVEVEFYDNQGEYLTAVVLDLHDAKIDDVSVLKIKKERDYNCTLYLDNRITNASRKERNTYDLQNFRSGRGWKHNNLPDQIYDYPSGVRFTTSRDFNTKAGNSGGPIFTEEGIIGMIKGRSDSELTAIKIHSIKAALLDWNIPVCDKEIHPPYRIDIIDVTPKMVFISNGTFTKKCKNNSNKVIISHPFYISETEVTVKDYNAFLKWSNIDTLKLSKNLPVVNVSWQEAFKYTEWLSKKTGNNYRLPTEMEWEYAAKSDDANWIYKLNSINNKQDETIDVLNCEKNPWGLYGILGNVSEWVEDNWQENCAPNTNGDPKNIKNNTYHVVRGGSWLQGSAGVNYRDKATSGSQTIGFRVVRDITK